MNFSSGVWGEAAAEVELGNFYAQKQLLFSARLSHRSSVCLSVCLSVRPSSVCPSHGWISQKWCKL